MGLDVGVHVKRKAREFGDEWARQTFEGSQCNPTVYLHVLQQMQG